MKILLTAFLPFQGDSINVSYELLKCFKKSYKSHSVEKLILDVAYELDGKKVIAKIEEFHPDLVISFGQAKGRNRVCLEAIALNVRHASIEDNCDVLYRNQKICQENLAYETKLDIFKISEKLSKEKFAISYHAGTFVCNDVYYMVLDYISKHNLKTLCGFVHLPCLKEQVTKEPFMELEEMYRIVTSLIDAILEA